MLILSKRKIKFTQWHSISTKSHALTCTWGHRLFWKFYLFSSRTWKQSITNALSIYDVKPLFPVLISVVGGRNVMTYKIFLRSSFPFRLLFSFPWNILSFFFSFSLPFLLFFSPFISIIFFISLYILSLLFSFLPNSVFLTFIFPNFTLSFFLFYYCSFLYSFSPFVIPFFCFFFISFLLFFLPSLLFFPIFVFGFYFYFSSFLLSFILNAFLPCCCSSFLL